VVPSEAELLSALVSVVTSSSSKSEDHTLSYKQEDINKDTGKQGIYSWDSNRYFLAPGNHFKNRPFFSLLEKKKDGENKKKGISLALALCVIINQKQEKCHCSRLRKTGDERNSISTIGVVNLVPLHMCSRTSLIVFEMGKSSWPKIRFSAIGCNTDTPIHVFPCSSHFIWW
jgi:hypothetical protein